MDNLSWAIFFLLGLFSRKDALFVFDYPALALACSLFSAPLLIGFNQNLRSASARICDRLQPESPIGLGRIMQ
jgi:hypothetical protein